VETAADGELARTGYDSIPAIAAVLFSRYALAFQAAGLLLLVTMVAVVVLAKRQRRPSERAAHARRAGSSGFSLGDPEA
jgi:hypothetical protein